ncbi:MAG: indolepyruvate oxidoreductase subunit beta family protein [Tabrizicola sp.]|uniref:indolepyruvate oxidoreductase subunit beta family protein n=1 Tax=Tabrizicola sp. TaxID=2005166 RepID=UPI0027322C2E|nr:indolepyruvate oxidoreductase subunit beta family protein [Tabrizicola sp.]MDP3264699.1 indolepyruvate oxidoreductase subunit beta family protein [Tabrizicola sp.]MDP3649894.1 indolepyruvate oxidoreductase subunit beta family protein [Paracoccaceae bacterium]MDZ4067844.1 indolepyruvate oxidoreductase subunit beta family protein [Tabrizicola sp.]
MTLQSPMLPVPAGTDGMIKLAVLAVGGQGGGVLTGWIETLARANGYVCQATSVAGVAQRTGATVYYVEMAPATGRVPVFSLMPAAGDVDVMITAEMMEAGRSIIRGFVTPDRTVLITSTHRALAVSEKMVPGDGIASSEEVIAAAEVAARRFIAADFDAVAVKNGSVISATLFGALAASGALPFAREAFEAAIRAGGRGVEASVRAFGAGYEAALAGVPEAAVPEAAAPMAKVSAVRGPARKLAEWERLMARVAALPAAVAELAAPGLRKVVDFQDLAYGAEYLARIEGLVARDAAPFEFAREAAKYVANAMAYDDVIRVADLKTRGRRFERIRGEMGVREAQVMQLTEFFHPRAEEIAGLLSAGLGAKVQASPVWMARLDRWFGKGRRLRTDSLAAYLTLYAIGGLRGWRRRTLRHAQEVAHLEGWLAVALGYLESDRALAVEVVRCRRLVKGYSDTHARGLSKFDRVLAGIEMVAGRADAGPWAARLREAALKDEEGRALEGALATIRSFV